jgi:hypothetical protein
MRSHEDYDDRDDCDNNGDEAHAVSAGLAWPLVNALPEVGQASRGVY